MTSRSMVFVTENKVIKSLKVLRLSSPCFFYRRCSTCIEQICLIIIIINNNNDNNNNVNI